MRKNPESRFEVMPVPDEDPRRFQRMFCSVGPAIQIAYGIGMKFSAVDAAFLKHTIYRDGCFHLLTTRDGNNRVLPLAWAICETESGATYTWFAAKCMEAGLGRYLGGCSVIFSDRMKGINDFFDSFDSWIGSCFKHIIGNCRKHCAGSGTTFEDRMAWMLQRAPTRADYERQLAAIKSVCPPAAHYFDTQCFHNHVYQYKWNQWKIPTQGFSTSQIVECVNGVFVGARFEAPYRFNPEVLLWMGKQFEARTQEMKEWIAKGHILTPYAHNLFAVQVGPTLTCL